MSEIKHIIFDFDGTCTQIPKIYEDFSEEYRQNFSDTLNSAPVTKEEWASAEKVVRANSPREGWNVGGTPSAPVGADPYIMADESAKLIARQRNIQGPSGSGLHSGAYRKFAAPWRPETRGVLCEVHRRGIGIHFISNSSSDYISGRLDELLANNPEVRKDVSIESDAGKFFIRELTWGGTPSVDEQLRKRFEALPAAEQPANIPFSRPIYLRRGSYFEAICRALGNNPANLESTLVCGDVWELDLAMPFHLGLRVHLIERDQPFDTCEYERAKIKACGARGGMSTNLKGILSRLAKV